MGPLFFCDPRGPELPGAGLTSPPVVKTAQRPNLGLLWAFRGSLLVLSCLFADNQISLQSEDELTRDGEAEHD